jgi:hypothetical protein
MRRAALIVAFAGLSFALPAVPLRAQTAGASPTPTPNVYRSLESGPAHDAGEIRGTIDSVDYPGGTLVVRSGKDKRVVAVVPSTTIYRHGQYSTLADLRRGQKVDISVYEVGGHLVAQTIRI